MIFILLFNFISILAKKNDVTVAVDGNSISTDGFTFSYTFDTVIPGAMMYYSVTEAGVARYRAGDVQDGFDSIAHGSRDDTDMDTHEVRVDVQLEESETYLLWVAYGTPDDLQLEKTNIVHVPKPCSATPNVADATAECSSTDACSVSCDYGFEGGSAEYFCEIDGTWSSSEDLICTPVQQCPAAISIPNAESQCDDLSPGATCQVGCNLPEWEGQSIFTCGEDLAWLGELTCQPSAFPPGIRPNIPGQPTIPGSDQTCTDTVTGIDHGASQCMDTSEGAQCIVTCMDGTTGEGTFTCQSGIWMGTLKCSPPPQAAKFALFASGQFCEPEDFEHIYFGPVTSASECAYKASQNPYCTDKFYTGCCGSAVCACVRIGMRCSLEEADEEYMGSNVYQLINSDHPNNAPGKPQDQQGGSGGFPGFGNNEPENGGFGGGFQGGWQGGNNEQEYPEPPQQGGTQGAFPQGGLPWGGFGQDMEPPMFPPPFWNPNFGGNQGGSSGPMNGPDNGWNPNGDEIETTTTTTTTTTSTTTTTTPNNDQLETCFDLIDDCKAIKASNMCDVVDACPRSCGICTPENIAYATYRPNAYCRSQVQGQYVLKEIPNASGPQECANAVADDVECSAVFTGSETFCACVQRGTSCDPDFSAHGNTIYYISQRLGYTSPVLQSTRSLEALTADESQPILQSSRSSTGTNPFPTLFFILLIGGFFLFGALLFWRSRLRAKLRRDQATTDYYIATEA